MRSRSTIKLITAFTDSALKARVGPLTADAKALDKLCIPTRYSEGLPDMIPAEAYTFDENSEIIRREVLTCEVVPG